ncbi:Bax inhibitor-1/YccA family membrane protein [Paenibacillus bovis]|uniref:Bax inhibitor-1/YccA family protein n=1 Tax=Paenibacillus bovis TaxID=1616788 RepID=A0A172ZFT2_9BACL|nr:Bax inhibitor-1/YccA family protein [Paenibacillus bovis]ANF96127.1 hypothetical protein AR543_09040 [Paenibacillus bovis]
MALRNPVFNNRAFSEERDYDQRESMTIAGAAGKALVLTVLLILSAAYTWYLFNKGEDIRTYMIVGMIGSLVIALPTTFFPKIAPVTAPLYVIVNGLALGGLSAMVETVYPGIALNAVLITVGILFFMLLLYATRIVRVTPGLAMGIMLCTLAIAFVYLINFVLSFFGMSVPYIHDTGWIGIGISIFVVIVATANLLLDFRTIEESAQAGMPKYMEWYGAFGLMVTVIWMYVEILRLLSKLASRD